MTNYQAMKEELNKNKETLEIASKKSNELDKTTNDIKDIINNLKKHQQLKISTLFQKMIEIKLQNMLIRYKILTKISKRLKCYQ